MNGPEHYKEAERLLRAVEVHERNFYGPSPNDVAKAQVHATLALAGALDADEPPLPLDTP